MHRSPAKGKFELYCGIKGKETGKVLKGNKLWDEK